MLQLDVGADSDAIDQEKAQLAMEMASVEQSLRTLKSKNADLQQRESEKAKTTSEQSRQIVSRRAQIDAVNQKLESLIAENEQRARMPDQTVQEYARQLADRGDVMRLQQLHQATYSRISFLVSQENMKALQSHFSQMQPGQTPPQMPMMQPGQQMPMMQPGQQMPMMPMMPMMAPPA